ncbi:hypothetical protein TSOC_012744 [Tetrabaena socialis]|uniref:CRM domain-containing protein n=1 Tax=Tetrabaena socialis TaxID=47790 RepID=A0A2J7ZM87_9CHLO|nr:hypothetical protein TSOC_012744 [Tetrabaena socialis]|eukprot:PNH01377.1 hypothetical protein TSOC_012744 [Tetrabaena socialis]
MSCGVTSTTAASCAGPQQREQRRRGATSTGATSRPTAAGGQDQDEDKDEGSSGLGGDDDDEDIGFGTSGNDGADDAAAALGPPPAVRYQRPLPLKDRKPLRARAETLARERRLVRVQLGQLGVTPAFLRSAAAALAAHELVRVKLGEGCGLERRAAAALLEAHLDCCAVHQVGFTVTLYRQSGLPRQANTLPVSGEEARAAETAAAAAEAAALAAEASVAKCVRKRAGQQPMVEGQRPPEFSVL